MHESADITENLTSYYQYT